MSVPTDAHGTPPSGHSVCSRVRSWAPVQLLLRMPEQSPDWSSVGVCGWLLFWAVAVLPAEQPACCSDHASLPVKKFYKIGFTHQICGVSVSWYSSDSIESSGLSCPLRCQLHCTSALQVDIFAGMQTILYLPYNILSALLYLSQFT